MKQISKLLILVILLWSQQGISGQLEKHQVVDKYRIEIEHYFKTRIARKYYSQITEQKGYYTRDELDKLKLRTYEVTFDSLPREYRIRLTFPHLIFNRLRYGVNYTTPPLITNGVLNYEMHVEVKLGNQGWGTFSELLFYTANKQKRVAIFKSIQPGKHAKTIKEVIRKERFLRTTPIADLATMKREWVNNKTKFINMCIHNRPYPICNTKANQKFGKSWNYISVQLQAVAEARCATLHVHSQKKCVANTMKRNKHIRNKRRNRRAKIAGSLAGIYFIEQMIDFTLNKR